MKYARFYNPIVSFLLRLGMPHRASSTAHSPRIGTLASSRTTPVALNPYGAGWLLVSVYGRVDWVRNLRAAEEAVVTMRRRTFPVTSAELTADQAAPLVRDLLVLAEPDRPPCHRLLLRHRFVGADRGMAGGSPRGTRYSSSPRLESGRRDRPPGRFRVVY